MQKIFDALDRFFLKIFGKKKKGPQLTEEEDRARREELRAQLNHPEDSFTDDEVLNEEELKTVSRRYYDKDSQKRGYYIFGIIMALALMIYGLVRMLTAAKGDLYILMQSDGLMSQEEYDSLQEQFASYASDVDGDGKVTVIVTLVSLPSQHTDENDRVFESGISQIEEEMVPLKYALLVGREEFIEAGDAFRPMRENEAGEIMTPLTGTAFQFSDDSTFNEYYIAVRAQQREGDDAALHAQAFYEAAVAD